MTGGCKRLSPHGKEKPVGFTAGQRCYITAHLQMLYTHVMCEMIRDGTMYSLLQLALN